MYALVGYRHNCRPVERQSGVGLKKAVEEIREAIADAEGVVTSSRVTTYRYRNEGKRRDYQRELMRKRRAAKAKKS